MRLNKRCERLNDYNGLNKAWYAMKGKTIKLNNLDIVPEGYVNDWQSFSKGDLINTGATFQRLCNARKPDILTIDEE